MVLHCRLRICHKDGGYSPESSRCQGICNTNWVKLALEPISRILFFRKENPSKDAFIYLVRLRENPSEEGRDIPGAVWTGNPAPYFVLRRIGLALPARLLEAAVSSYLTISTLPAFAKASAGYASQGGLPFEAPARERSRGGIFSAALSVASL